MGQTVKQAVAPVAQAANKVVSGVKDVASGSVAKGIGEAGAGYVDAVKGTFGVTSDNKSSLLATSKTALGEFSANPAAFAAGAVEAYSTGGASLVPGIGQSILTGAMGASPGELAKGGGGAPVLPGNPPSAGVYSGAAGIDFTMPLVLVIGGVLLYSIARR